MRELEPAGGVVGPVYNISDIVDDPHYQERGDILEIEDSELGKTRMMASGDQLYTITRTVGYRPLTNSSGRTQKRLVDVDS